MTEVFKKCTACDEQQLTDKDYCRKCNAKFDEEKTETNGKFKVVSSTSKGGSSLETKEAKFADPPEFCTDCLKSKGISVVLSIIIFAAIVAGTAVLQVYDIKWYIYWFFWGIWLFATGLSGYACGLLLIVYCTKNTNDYKDQGLLFMFSVLTIITIVAIFVIIANMPSNFEWVDKVWFK